MNPDLSAPTSGAHDARPDAHLLNAAHCKPTRALTPSRIVVRPHATALSDSLKSYLPKFDRLLRQVAAVNCPSLWILDESSAAGQTLEDLLLHAPVALMVLSQDAEVQFVNVAAAGLLGGRSDELIGSRFATFFSDTDWTRFSTRLALQAGISTGSGNTTANAQQAAEVTLIRADRSTRQVRVQAALATDSQSYFVAMIECASSSEASREFSHELGSEHRSAPITESNRRSPDSPSKASDNGQGVRRDWTLESVIRSVDQAMVILDSTKAGSPIVFANDGFERLTGFTAEEAVGQGIELLQGMRTEAGAIDAFRSALAQGQSLDLELWLHTKSQVAIRCAAHVSPLNSSLVSPLNDDHLATLAVVFLSNITDRCAAENQLRQAEKMEAIGQLSGGIAHGFNNLLTVIQGYTGLLLDAPEQFAEHSQEFLLEIRSATARAAELTQQLLAHGRRQQLHPSAFDLNHLVREVMSRVSFDGVQLETMLDAKLTQVWADRSQVAQILLNLIHNSVDAMAGGGRLAVTTKSIELNPFEVSAMSNIYPGKYAMLSVSDTGCGMTESVRSRVFEPFFTTKPLGKGTGLGLSAVQGVVAQSGGFVELSSAPNRGTSVNLYLPEEKMPPQTAPQSTGKPQSNPDSETILLVEDEESVRNIVRILLARSGYKVLEAANGREAINIVDNCSQTIHMLISDVVMPGMHGPEVAKAVLAKRPSIRVMLMSGYVDDAKTRDGLADTAANFGFLQKPFTGDELTRKVRAALDA